MSLRPLSALALLFAPALLAQDRPLAPAPRPVAEKPAIIATQPLTPINAAAVRRDGRYLAFGLDSNAVVLWDTADGRPVRTLLGHQKVVLSVAFTPDGKHLASGSADSTAMLWDVETGAHLKTFKGHSGVVASVAFSPDGTKLLTGSPDGTAILRDTRTGDPLHTLKSKEVLGVAYSPDGSTIATASADSTATLWDTTTGQPKVVLRGHKEGVTCVTFSPDGGRVLTGSFENFGIVWDAATGKRIATTGRHGNDVYSVAFAPDGKRVVTGEREEVVMMWDAASGEHVRTFAGHNADIVSIVPNADGRTMLTGSRDGTARLWDAESGRELLTLTTDASRKTWAAVAPDGLFDASDAGRRALGYRFAKRTGEVDQFFVDGYRPGLLVRVWRGERPTAVKPLGHATPPLVKFVPPKERAFATPEATFAVDVTDTGDGVSPALIVENNGVRVAVKTKVEPANGATRRVTFTVPLAPGANRFRVRAPSGDGSWESPAVEVELTHPRALGQKGRLYVVAVGVGMYAEQKLALAHSTKDARALAELLQKRGGADYDRVDIVHVSDRDATKATIEDTVRDVAELTRPQDAVAVLLCGRGSLLGDRLYFASHDLRFGTDSPEVVLKERGVAVDELAAALGGAAALRRVLVIDTVEAGAPKARAEFGLRGAVGRWGRNHSVHALAAVTDHGLLAQALLTAAEAPTPLDVIDWFQSAADRAASRSSKLIGPRPNVEAGTRARGFPILAPGK